MKNKLSVLDWMDDILKDYLEYEEIAAAEDPQFEKLYDLVARWNKNIFPKQAYEEGIEKFEELLNITPYPEDTLEDRRYRVIAKLNAKLPYTEVQLRRILGGILGYEGFTLTVKDLILTLSLAEENNNKVRIIYELLKEIIPMNILIKLNQFINQRLELRLITFNKIGNRIKIYPVGAETVNAEAIVGVCTYTRFTDRIQIYPERSLEAEGNTYTQVYSFVQLGQRVVIKGE